MVFKAKFFNLLKNIKPVISLENLSFKKIICYISIIFSSTLAAVGFFSTATGFYIGDLWIRTTLAALGLIFSLLIFYSYVKLNQSKNLLGIIGFTVIVFLLSYFLPQMPPHFGLRTYDVDASILKFMLTSLIFIVVGVAGGSLSMKPLFDFSSKSKEYSAYYILVAAILLILYPLVIIVGTIFSNGISGISWEFLTEDLSRHGAEGGIYPALVGTILIIIGTTLVSLPLGVGCAIYLQEYAKKGPITRVINICVDILQGTPSIVHGLFGLAIFVPLFGVSLLTGCLIMGFLTLPIVIRASEEALRSVPEEIREGSYALGATKWESIKTAVLPPALPGIITGSVLGLGRAAGETAPLIFTATFFLGAGIPQTPLQPIQALSVHLYTLISYIGNYPVEQNAWSTALLLLSIVLGINAIGIIVREKYRIEF
ncbi:MAG: phosphate ABC transporter permease PstA [Candidatus Thermoplasmatota archaeon]